MAERGISGLPVVNANGHVLGVVSGADIIVKAASRGMGLIGRLWTPAGVDDRRLAATTAGEAMTTPAVTTAPDRAVTEAAWLMVERNVNRLPVVREDKLVGIISRGDLIRVFVRSDSDIWEELQSKLRGRDYWLAPDDVEVKVAGGPGPHIRSSGVENRGRAGGGSRLACTRCRLCRLLRSHLARAPHIAKRSARFRGRRRRLARKEIRRRPLRPHRRAPARRGRCDIRPLRRGLGRSGSSLGGAVATRPRSVLE